MTPGKASASRNNLVVDQPASDVALIALQPIQPFQIQAPGARSRRESGHGGNLQQGLFEVLLTINPGARKQSNSNRQNLIRTLDEHPEILKGILAETKR